MCLINSPFNPSELLVLFKILLITTSIKPLTKGHLHHHPIGIISRAYRCFCSFCASYSSSFFLSTFTFVAVLMSSRLSHHRCLDKFLSAGNKEWIFSSAEAPLCTVGQLAAAWHPTYKPVSMRSPQWDRIEMAWRTASWIPPKSVVNSSQNKVAGGPQ